MNEHCHRTITGYGKEHKHATDKECGPMESRMKEDSEQCQYGD